MKPYKTLLFIAGVFALMGAGWVFFPADGIDVWGLNLRFMSMERSLANAAGENGKVDVDAVVQNVESSFEMLPGNTADTLEFFRNFLKNSPNRISVPGDDWGWFDDVFADMETASRKGRVVRVVHYGDSQIEMDRISSDLRDGLQARFGGNGTGMFPAISNVPSASIYKSASGGMVHYTMYGDSTTRRAPHNRYGVLSQLTGLSGGGTGYFSHFPPCRVRPVQRVRLQLLLPFGGDRCLQRAVIDQHPEQRILPDGFRGLPEGQAGFRGYAVHHRPGMIMEFCADARQYKHAFSSLLNPV